MIQQSIVLIEPNQRDKSFEECRIIKKGNQVLKTFDSWGRFYPLHFGKQYRVELTLEQLDYEPPEIQTYNHNVANQIDQTFYYDLYGRVENGIFIVGNFKFDWDQFEDNPDYENKFVKLKVARIIVEFLEELD